MDDFTAQVVAYLPQLRRYARSMCRNWTTCDDLVQDTVLRALEKQHQFTPDGSEASLLRWLNTILHNMYINHIRRETRGSTRIVSLDAPVPLNLIPTEPSHEAGVIARRDGNKSFNQLWPEHQQVLLMIADGKSYDEIARELQMFTGTVRSRISRARQYLRQLMDGGRVSEAYLRQHRPWQSRAPRRLALDDPNEIYGKDKARRAQNHGRRGRPRKYSPPIGDYSCSIPKRPLATPL